MVHLRLLILIANLLFLRTIFGQVEEDASVKQLASNAQRQASAGLNNSLASSNLEEPTSSSADVTILNGINSLDFAASPIDRAAQPLQQAGEQQKQLVEQAGISIKPNETIRSARRRTSKSDHGDGKQRRRKAQSIPLGQLLINMLGQLERIDLKRIIVDSLEQVKRSSQSNEQSLDWLASIVAPLWSSRAKGTSRSSNGGPVKITSANQTIANKYPSNKTRERISLGSLSAETGNLLSITKQLVKLARSGITGSEFGMGLGHSLAPWMAAPIMMPSMLTAASHMLHDTGNDFTSAALKSDWFWVVVPAVIVIGAGVIVIPLIAAWLVSHMMNQNTFTVTPAGRRRRKRHVSNSYQNTGPSFHADLFKMLDMHQLLDDEPELLVGKLSRLHGALDSIGSGLLESLMQTDKNGPGRRLKSGAGSKEEASVSQ